jgi:hypothetical protein
VECGDDDREVITDVEDVTFVVRTVEVSETGDSHSESSGVPDSVEGVGGEMSRRSEVRGPWGINLTQTSPPESDTLPNSPPCGNPSPKRNMST